MSAAITSRLPDVIKTLKILKNVVALAPLGEQVGAGIELAISICEMAEGAKANRAAYEELGVRIAALLAGMSNVVQKTPTDRLQSVESNLGDVLRVLTDAQGTVRAQTTRLTKPSKSFFGVFKGSRAEKDQEEISVLEAKISAALERFQVESNIRLELVTQHVTEMMKEQKMQLAAIRESQDRASYAADMACLKELSYIPSARYDSDELHDQVMTCLEGTRVDLLADLDTWAASPTSAPIFWLNGLAGTGKSTVARTFCERVSKRRDPSVQVATFFISRHSTDRRKAVNILHTLVYQLAAQDSKLRSILTRAIAEEPDLLSRSLGHQVSKLLGETLACLKPSRPAILVLDALDECEADAQGRQGGELLPLLAKAVDASASFFNLLVTSRLEPTIRKMFDGIQAPSSARSEVLRLHDIDRTIVRNDIRQYLVHSLRALAVTFKADDWPSQDQLELLLDNADVLFIYAATVVRYIGHRLYDPRKRLKQVLARAGGSSKSAYRHLDVLYQGVLANAIPVDEDEGADEPIFTERLRMVLGIVVLAMHPLSPSSIAGLLGWSVHETEVTLAQLSAVLIVHNDEPVRIFHPSFPDFLLDVSRCADARLRVDARRHHSLFARRSLSVMNDMLHRDMLGTGLDPLVNNKDIPHLDNLLSKKLPTHVQYAVVFWIPHFTESIPTDELMDVLDIFCHTHLFHWLECLSYMDRLDSALSSLPGAVAHLDGSRPSKELLTDLHYTLRDYCSTIRASGAHVYHSALASMPSCRLYDLSSHEVGDVVLLTPRQPGFSLEFTFMQGRVTARLLAISQDGSRISCLEHDTLSIGNTSSGEMRKLANRTDFQYMLAIGFSADGHQLLVADQRCHIHSKDVDNVCSDWVDLPPAEEVGASMRAARATFSHDGVYCAFIVEYRDYSNPTNPWPNPNLFLRRVHTNSPLHLLNHSRTMTDFDKVVFTPNAQYLVQSSALSIVVWNVDQRTLHAQGLIANPRSYELGTYITALAPISNTVCSSLTSDGAVYIWNINDGSLLRKFDGDNSLILDHPRSTTRLVALSTLGSEPLLGLMINSTVKVLDVTAKDPVITQHTFHPHPLFGFISSIILDGLSSRIYLIDHGDQLVCWNYKLTSTPGPGKVDFSSAIRCTAFSSDGGLLVSGSQDGSITIWQTTTNRQIAKHTGKGAISSVAFSTSSARFVLSVQYETDHADGLFISNCQTFEVVDANTGEIKTACQINSCPSAHDLALSPNGERLALQLAMDDRIVGLYLLNGHSGKVIARDLYDLVDQWNMRTELLFTQDSHSLIQRRGEQPILIRDAQTLEIRRTISYNGLVMNTYPALTLSPRSSHVGLVYQDGCHVRFQAWNIQSGALEISGALVQVLQDSSYFNIWLCIWTPRYLIYASKDSVTTWDSDDSTPATVHKWPKAWKVEDVCVSHDESCLYAWCGDQRIRAWTTADFNITRPILELETSEWMERLPPGWHLHQRYLICASHDATHFQAVFSVQRTYFILTVDLASRNCVSMTHLGEHRLITGANISFIDSRLYTYGPVGGYDKSDLLPYLTWIPIDNDYDAADWAQTVGDAFEVLQGMLLQVWNMETGEMEAIVKWTEDNTQLESVPSSSSLRLPRGQYGQNTRLNAVYDDPSDSWIRIYSTLSSSTHVCSIGTSPDRRPSGPTAFAIHDRLVAIGSTHGTVSIFDVTKAVEIAEAKKKLEQGSSTQAT